MNVGTGRAKTCGFPIDTVFVHVDLTARKAIVIQHKDFCINSVYSPAGGIFSNFEECLSLDIPCRAISIMHDYSKKQSLNQLAYFLDTLPPSSRTNYAHIDRLHCIYLCLDNMPLSYDVLFTFVVFCLFRRLGGMEEDGCHELELFAA